MSNATDNWEAINEVCFFSTASETRGLKGNAGKRVMARTASAHCACVTPTCVVSIQEKQNAVDKHALVTNQNEINV